MPADVAGPPQAEGDHPGASSFVRQAVDQNKGTGVAVVLVGVERERRGGRQVAEPDLIETQGLVRQLRQGLDIDPMLEGGDGGRNRARADFQQVGAAGNQLLVAEPDDMSGELVDALWPITW